MREFFYKTNIKKSALVFLSYSNSDKDLAGQLKFSLECFGIDVFLAHEDIEPSAEWQETILQNLEACNIFLPLLTNDFKFSAWTDQETGIAVFLKKFIIPLKIDINPYGFIAKYQALKFNKSRFQKSSSEIILAVGKHEAYLEAVKDWVICTFANSDTFGEAGKRAELLLKFGEYDETQLRDILKVSAENSQIYQSFKATDILKILISKFEDKMDKKLLKKYNDIVSPPF